jgi:crossover junction endodeoxyribonuclease RuvC
MRVLGIDPGLTRCGVGVVDRDSKAGLRLVDCGVIRTSPDAPLESRLMELETEIALWIARFKPDVVAIERVFSQLNVRTAMATGQAAGVAILLAAKSGIPIAHHTPSEVKAAVSGSGRADKKQVATMVVRILGLDSPPKPVDTTDALALAICHLWRGANISRLNRATRNEKNRLSQLSRLKRVK